MNNKLNLPPPGSIALKKLQDNKDIIFKKADKGGAVVVWHCHIYTFKRLIDSYKTLSITLNFDNPPPHMTEEQTALLNRPQTTVGSVPMNMASCHVNTLTTFYMLPKVHKELKDNPLGRPIVATNGTHTEPASHFIDYYLKPYINQLPSDIRDTTDV